MVQSGVWQVTKMNRLGAAVIAPALALLLMSTGAALAGPLHDAARAGDNSLVLKLIKSGVNIDEQDETGATPLFAAAQTGHEWVIDQLLMNKADMSIRDNNGMTALHAAAATGSAQVVSWLINGPDHNSLITIDIDDNANTLGVTPLMVAADKGHGNVVAYLKVYGADVEKPDPDGYTALTRVGRRGNDEVIAILLRLGAKCQEVDPTWFEDCRKRRTALGL